MSAGEHADPVAEAQRQGLHVLIADLGDWRPAKLLAELDREQKAIRLNQRVVERLAQRHGPDMVQWFIACAVSHELYHYIHPGCPEGDAHAFALLCTGTAPVVFESMLEGC